MGVRVEEIKVILRGRSAYALFMGWLKATRRAAHIGNQRIRITRIHEDKDEHF